MNLSLALSFFKGQGFFCLYRVGTFEEERILNQHDVIKTNKL